MTALLCGPSQTHLGTLMPPGGGHIINANLRPSGNAPEFRVYVEAASEAEAQNLLDRAPRMVNIGLGNI
jgi:phosphomannomutase